MRGMVLPGDGDGEHPLPGPGLPFRGWTEGRLQDSAGGGEVTCEVLCTRLFLHTFTESFQRPHWAYSSGIQAWLRMSKSPDRPESVGY